MQQHLQPYEEFATLMIAAPMVAARRAYKELVPPIACLLPLINQINTMYRSLVSGAPDDKTLTWFRILKDHSPVCVLEAVGKLALELSQDPHFERAVMEAGAQDDDVKTVVRLAVQRGLPDKLSHACDEKPSLADMPAREPKDTDLIRCEPGRLS